MKHGLLILLLLVACTAFDADHEGAPGADGGPGSSSSGSTASDASSDAPAVVDGGTCPKVAPFAQTFPGGSFGNWNLVSGTPSTDFTGIETGGKSGDGSIFFSYSSDDVNARRNVVQTTLPTTARCFELAVDFKVSHVDNKELVFAQVIFQNGHLIGLALDPQLHLILGQQDPSTADGGASGGASALAVSVASVTANKWHTAVLRLELLGPTLIATGTVDGSVTATSTPGALVEFDSTKSVEVGVSYVFATGSGDMEIDRVAFQ